MSVHVTASGFGDTARNLGASGDNKILSKVKNDLGGYCHHPWFKQPPPPQLQSRDS